MTDEERTQKVARLALLRRRFLDAYKSLADWHQIRVFSGITEPSCVWAISLAHADAVSVVQVAGAELAKASAELFPPPPAPAPPPAPPPDRSKN